MNWNAIFILGGLITIFAAIFAFGRFTGTLTAAINKAVEIFELRLNSVTEDIRELKDSNKDLYGLLNEISNKQMVEIEKDIVRLDGESKSAHDKIAKIECIVDRRIKD